MGGRGGKGKEEGSLGIFMEEMGVGMSFKRLRSNTLTFYHPTTN